MSYTESEAKKLLFQAIKVVQDHPDLGAGWLVHNFSTLVHGYRIDDYLYEPDEALVSRIGEYNRWCQDQQGEDPGQLMEEIAFLAFRCIRGWNAVKSYQSYAAQHDLVISGSDSDWKALMEYLHLDWKYRTIVVEAKNLSEIIDDKQFSRLCGILQNIFKETCKLGVFFSRFGASGFPEENRKQQPSRQRSISNALATQIIFHAGTGKFVVVLEDRDIQNLVQPGALPRILEAKIRAVEEWTGLPIEFDGEWKEIDLPTHLLQHMRQDEKFAGPLESATDVFCPNRIETKPA
jgi:hypothetical protein